MGNSTSQKLFQQHHNKPSNRAREQLWQLYYHTNQGNIQIDLREDSFEGPDDKTGALFYQGSKEYLDFEQSKAFLSDLFDYLMNLDLKRTRPTRNWEDKELIIKQWMQAYGTFKQPEILKKSTPYKDDIDGEWELVDEAEEVDDSTYQISKKNFFFALMQIEVEKKIENFEKQKVFEENWEMVDEKVGADITQARIDELTLKQVDLLLENGRIAFNKQCHRIAHKKYQFALNIIESYLAELPLTQDVQSSMTVLLFKKKLFETKRKIEYNTYAEEELVAKLSGALKDNLKSIESLPARGFYIVARELGDANRFSLKCTSKFLNNAVYCVTPLIRRNAAMDQINWKNLSDCLLSKDNFSMLHYLFPEIKIQIFSKLPLNDRLQIRAVSKGLKVVVDDMLAAEFQAMHLNNFFQLNEKIVEIGEGSYSEQAVETSGAVGLTMIKISGEMMRGAGGIAGSGVVALVYLGIVLGICTVGGILFLESKIGGPISGSIGKLVEIGSVAFAQDEKISEAHFCRHCDKELSLFSSKWVCRACRATFCTSCSSHEVMVLVKESTYTVQLCGECHHLIDLQYDRDLIEGPKKVVKEEEEI